jgi:D-lactate dehydrogenase
MKIVAFEVEEKDRDFFLTHLNGLHISITNDPLSKQNVESYADAEIIVVRSYSSCSRETISLFPHLKLIVTRTTGTDHIDLSYCKERGITVCNVPGYGQYTVAEHTYALLLAISRNIIPSVEAKGRDFSVSEIMGFELFEKTFGVIGVGSIGGAVIKIGNAFGMEMIAHTKDHNEELAREIGYSNVTLDELYAQSDIISLHVPYTPDTHHLINASAIAKMKKGVVIINTARGAVIDTKALIEGLRFGKIKAAGLDVLEHERDFTSLECELFSMPNVIITPHNGFNSVEALHRILVITIGNIRNFIAGTPQNMV